MVDSLNGFTLKLARLFRENTLSGTSGNYVISPLSVALDLAMLADGAKGPTRDEILSALGAPVGQNGIPTIDKVCNMMMRTLNREDSVCKISMNNSLWIDKKFKVYKEYRQKCDKIFMADVFRRRLSTDKTKNEINCWVKERTGGAISNLLSKPLSASQKLALINTVYLKADWVMRFDTDGTHPEVFHNVDSTAGICDMMQRKGVFIRGLSCPKYSATQLGLADNTLNMTLILPVGDTTTDECFSMLGTYWLDTWKEQSNSGWESLKMPKWDTFTTHDFMTEVYDIGIQSISSGKADFSDISPTPGVTASRILHKANVTVNEKGTEAAAATIVTLDTSSGGGKHTPRELVFNRPFIYMISDTKTNAILFIGEIRKF